MTKVWTLIKATEKIPVAGKYKCVVCGLIVDIDQHFIDKWLSFFACPICHAWTENGPKSPEEDVWEFLG